MQIMLIASSLLDFFLLDPQSLVRLAAHLEMYKSEDAPDVTFIMPFVNLAVPLVSDTPSLLEFYVTFFTARFSEESESASDFVWIACVRHFVKKGGFLIGIFPSRPAWADPGSV